MRFSKAAEYGIRATIFLSAHPNERIGIKVIAKEINSPEAFTAKILQQLVKKGIVNSVKGPKGGFEVDPNTLNDINVADIVYALDEEKEYQKCVLGLELCSDTRPCPVHHRYKSIRKDMNDMMQECSLQSLSDRIKSGKTFLTKE